MSDNTIHILLITDDSTLETALRQRQPTDTRLVCWSRASQSNIAHADIRQCWVDLDGAIPESIPPCKRYIYCATRPTSAPEGRPLGIQIRKPLPITTLDLLWADATLEDIASSIANTPEAAIGLPSWITDLQELRLDDLCRKCVEQLPAHLGYKRTSLYLYDQYRRELRFKQANHNERVETTIPVESGTENLMVAVGLSGEILCTDNINHELKVRQINRPCRKQGYPDAACLVAPLVNGGRLVGVVNFSGRENGLSTAERMPLDDIFRFIARAVQHAQEYDRARNEARIDALTGLFNYRWLSESLETEIRRSQRFGQPLSIILLDVDGLKAINDTHGHTAGDKMLQVVSHRISKVLRDVDTAARIGGDEFIVALPSTDLEGARHVAERIRVAICSPAIEFDGKTFAVSASLGVAQWINTWTVQQLIETADQAMYLGKRRGRNQVVAGPILGIIKQKKMGTSPCICQSTPTAIVTRSPE